MVRQPFDIQWLIVGLTSVFSVSPTYWIEHLAYSIKYATFLVLQPAVAFKKKKKTNKNDVKGTVIKPLSARWAEAIMHWSARERERDQIKCTMLKTNALIVCGFVLYMSVYTGVCVVL